MALDYSINPIRGCWVSLPTNTKENRTGIVLQIYSRQEGSQAQVKWIPTGEISVVPVIQLRNGFKLGMDVLAAHTDAGLKLQEGVIKQARKVGGSEQLLVEFNSSGLRRWIPFQFLQHIQGVKHGFITSKTGNNDQAERLRMRVLAHALTVWNENTGALSALDIDPLPHQIHLVHHIINSGNLNWMIADDVGLGKTIETGMLLAALRQRGLAKRILLITPAGLTKQWQDEMYEKFDLGDFQIYGDDFSINEPRHWKMHDNVIASIDRLKTDAHQELLLQAEPWDLVIFDEAHRLSRRLYGLQYDSSGRFELAANLRRYGKAQSMLLLTATPHQGLQDKFTSLLELLRPELKSDIELLSLKPQLLNDMVIRNYKADVTDLEGNFVFHGKSTHAMTVDINDEAKVFDRSLQNYLKQGYKAGEALGRAGNAIGFVMTVYRKLAASSVAAIHLSLERRLKRLCNEYDDCVNHTQDYSEDERYQGEMEENYDTSQQQFFEGEIELLEELIIESRALLQKDLKLELFLDQLLHQILADDPDKKVLIFSEYRATQDYLRCALSSVYGEHKVALLHGSLTRDERAEAIQHFEQSGQFLISTEAGGEGINLQRNCHIMVNYDLPWNPMRLVQRIGRLYRYGQKNKVVVFNIHSPDTVDEKIIGLMYERIDQVVKDLAVVQGDEFNDALKDDILGEISDLVDVEDILKTATNSDIERTKERIDEALNMAKESASKQRELFQYAAGFNPEELSNDLTITTAHVEAFVAGMCQILNIEIFNRTHSQRIWHLKLPEQVMKKLGTRRSKCEITFDRPLAKLRPGTVMMDMSSELLTFLVKTASSYRFEGKTAAVVGHQSMGDAFMAGLLRWQNDLGLRMKQEFSAFTIKNGKVGNNPATLGQWLLDPAQYGDTDTSRDNNRYIFEQCDSAANSILAQKANNHLFPEEVEWVGAAWVTSQRC
ncbi:DEAD/DEAH box helicase [uncultured Photobacterium sp.]|uniref:DEAD/DEAH box helicase n=1 Tax=uncultured Photobacterium sp. TaxID=173973 RepID=UPI0026382BE9|nr:DEAD/DEAH box helicase [uncultured Photobacterium sp.]